LFVGSDETLSPSLSLSEKPREGALTSLAFTFPRKDHEASLVDLAALDSEARIRNARNALSPIRSDIRSTLDNEHRSRERRQRDRQRERERERERGGEGRQSADLR
jgi:hypothetical protein